MKTNAMGWLWGFLALLFLSPWWAVIALGLLAPLLIAVLIAAVPVAFFYAMLRK